MIDIHKHKQTTTVKAKRNKGVMKRTFVQKKTERTTWLAIVVALFAVVCGIFMMIPRTMADSGLFSDDFSTYNSSGCPGYQDGQTFGAWKTVSAGNGCVQIVEDSAKNKSLRLTTKTPMKTNESFAASVVGPDFSQPFTYSGSVKTAKQLRSNAAPNAWESAWIVWGYTDADHYYYLIPKTNGWELGKRDPAYPSGQRYLATGALPTYSSSAWKNFKIEQSNAAITITIDDKKIATFTDSERPYTSGRIGIYAVDSRVVLDNVVVRTASNSTPPSTQPVGFSTEAGRLIPDMLHGVTTEYVTNLSALKTSLARHTVRPTTRVVFQEGTAPSYYKTPVTELRKDSYIMGQILDSTALSGVTAEQYRQRTREFVSTFKDSVDIYEIGNELNGEWVGAPAQTNAKVQAAYDVVEKDNASLNLRSAVTLNYWPSSNCYAKSWENTETYARDMPLEVRNGVDYLFLSFYETACSPRATPTNAEFIDIFTKMKAIFPNAKIGIGEIGAQGEIDGVPTPTLAEKQRIANRYYGMHGALKQALGERYVGGYFWWYYFQDAVPYNKSNSLWPTLENNFNALQ